MFIKRLNDSRNHPILMVNEIIWERRDMELNKVQVLPLVRESQILHMNQQVKNAHHQRPEVQINVQQENLTEVVQKLNEFIEPLRTNLKFILHDELNEYYVTIVNPLTNEVIKEIPPKKFLDMYAAMAELMGLMIDEKI